MGITNGIDIFQSPSGEAIPSTRAQLPLLTPQCLRVPAAAQPPHERLYQQSGLQHFSNDELLTVPVTWLHHGLIERITPVASAAGSLDLLTSNNDNVVRCFGAETFQEKWYATPLKLIEAPPKFCLDYCLLQLHVRHERDMALPRSHPHVSSPQKQVAS